MTTNLKAKLQESNPECWEAELMELISRHASGNWGDLDEEDKRQKILALDSGLRIFSAYETGSAVKIWIVTEADRSVTTALRPERLLVDWQSRPQSKATHLRVAFSLVERYVAEKRSLPRRRQFFPLR